MENVIFALNSSAKEKIILLSSKYGKRQHVLIKFQCYYYCFVYNTRAAQTMTPTTAFFNPTQSSQSLNLFNRKVENVNYIHVVVVSVTLPMN